VTELSKAFALAVPKDEAIRIRDDVGFFQAVRAALVKSASDGRKTDEGFDHAIRQIISKAMISDEVIDIFAAAGLKKPISRSSPTSSWPKSGVCHSGI
jgi:type I restriction enzyme, R subunit